MVLKGIECDVKLLNGKIEELICLAEDQMGAEIKSKLREIVSEYKSNDIGWLRRWVVLFYFALSRGGTYVLIGASFVFAIHWLSQKDLEKFYEAGVLYYPAFFVS